MPAQHAAQLELGFRAMFICPQCEYQTDTLQQLQVHKYRKHGIHSDISRFVRSSRCLACVKTFSSRSRLLDHFRYRSDRSKQVYFRRADYIEDGRYLALNKLDKDRAAELSRNGRRANFAEASVITHKGPRLDFTAQQAAQVAVDHEPMLE